MSLSSSLLALPCLQAETSGGAAKGSTPVAAGASTPGGSTPYLSVKGMVNAEVLADDEEYKEVGSAMR